jgi:hypothetical protein
MDSLKDMVASFDRQQFTTSSRSRLSRIRIAARSAAIGGESMAIHRRI